MPTDKLIHALGGLIIGLAVTLVSNPVAGVVAALLVGSAKEWIYDAWMGRGNFEAADLWATVAGGAIGAALGYGLPMIGKLA